MSFLAVFAPSVVMTTVVGGFMPLIWRAARSARAAGTFWGLALLVHAGWLAIPRLGGFAPVARWLAIMWLAAMLAAMVLLIPFALLNFFLRWRERESLAAFLAPAYAGCFMLTGIVLAITSTANFVVREEQIRIPGLPAGLEGFRIANLGDVHIGRFIDAKELLRGIRAINERNVDLLAITGDLVDDVDQLEVAMQALEQSNTPERIVAILGNHEEMGNLSRILKIFRRHQARVRLLINENMTIDRGGAALHIVGVNFPLYPRGGHLRPNPRQNEAMTAQADTAFAGLTRGEEIVALSHHPNFFPLAASHGAQLTLASHTHGGQLRLFGHPVVDVYPYLQGEYQLGDAHLDVSAGFGHWLPVRFGVPREMVIVTLRSASADQAPSATYGTDESRAGRTK